MSSRSNKIGIRFLTKVIRAYFWKILNHTARRLNVFWAFNSSIGIKQLNMSKLSHPGMWKGKLMEIQPETLFLGPDFLKDKHTLIGKSLEESPHYFLVKCISEGKDISNTDYFIRYTNGTLDWRLWQSPKCKDEIFRIKFEMSKKEIMENKYPPVIVYRIGDKQYLFDGKHRAAMCLLLEKTILCKEVENTVAWRGVFHFFFDIASKKKGYTKHNIFIDEAKKY